MSHIVTIKTQVKDSAAIRCACDRLKLDRPHFGTAKQFSAENTGWIVQLSGWKFPIVVQTEIGELKYDDFGGRWGDRVELERFLQAYAVEKAKLEAHRQGHSVIE